MDSLIQGLGNEPSLNEIDEILTTLLEDHRSELSQTTSSLLQLCTVLVSGTWLSMGSMMPVKTRKKLVKVVSCLSGISNVCARIDSLAEYIDKDSDHYLRQYAERKLIENNIDSLCVLLEQILRPGILNFLLTEYCLNDKEPKKRIQIREINSLFFGSKIFTRASMVAQILETSEKKTWIWLSQGIEYCEFIANELASLDDRFSAVSTDMLETGLKLGYMHAFTKVLLKQTHFNRVIDLFSYQKPNGKLFLLSHWILPWLQTNYLQYETGDINPTSTKHVAAVANLMSKLDMSKIYHQLYYHVVVTRFNIHIRRAVALSLKDKLEELLQNLLEIWGNKISIETNPVTLQEAQTQLLFISFSLLNPEFIKRNITSSRVYLDSISNRLSSLSAISRLLGILLAEHASKLSGDKKPLKFDLENIDYEDLELWRSKISRIKDEGLSSNDLDPWYILDTTDVRVEEPKEITQKFGELRTRRLQLVTDTNEKWAPDVQSGFNVVEPTSEPLHKTDRLIEIDSDDDNDFETEIKLQPYDMPDDDFEDSDDDPTLVTREKVSRPVYIKDLLEYLNMGTENYEKLHLALTFGSSLIKYKASYGQELKFYAKQLSLVLVGLQDSFDMDDFQHFRLNMLQNLVTYCPDTVPPYLAELLMSGDYSLQQRLSILSAITLGAMNLAGLSNNDGAESEKKEDKTPVISKLLPPTLHNFFKDDGDNDLQQLTKKLQNTLLEDTTTKVKDELIGGPQVIRVSRGLEKKRQGPQVRYTRNLYAKIAGPKFFFPLMGQWYSNGGIRNIGAYSDILASHFIKSFALLLHSAYPSSGDLVDMSCELLDLVLRMRGSKVNSIIESLLTCILVILDVNSSEFLVQSWPGQIVELQAWLNLTWKDIPDPHTQSLAAGVLYRLTELSDRWERVLIGEYATRV